MSKGAGINAKKKGSRVELELVHWMKERGVKSARRTQQFSGKEGTSDVVAPEDLPSFHIEVKGTATSKLEKSKLKKWVEQLYADCPENKLPVLFNKANNKDWIALVLDYEFITIFKDAFFVLQTSVEESFHAYECLNNAKTEAYVLHKFQTLANAEEVLTPPEVTVIYKVTDHDIVLAVEAETLLKYMLAYENRAKDN